jgi:UDP-N-acetylmuramoyl-L-alanyl-D-glutamate--2,6-diaminopimelate ligase
MDSRQVTPGALFVAVRGHHTDGHVFLDEALDRGATVLVVEEMPAALWPRVRAGEYTVLQVADSRKALALLASAYYGYPARHLRLVGVTGTNGKTTTTYIVEAILQAAGRAVGVLGTVNYRLGTHYLPAPQTTPDVLVLHQLLAQMVEAGIGDALIEVSSPALMQERVWGCRFETAVFTNMRCGRYDDHGSVETSWAVKARLFWDMAAAWHIVNLDDPCGQKLVQTSQARLLTY